MGHATYSELLELLVSYRDREYRSDPEREKDRLDRMEDVLQAMLEKLRDTHDPK